MWQSWFSQSDFDDFWESLGISGNFQELLGTLGLKHQETSETRIAMIDRFQFCRGVRGYDGCTSDFVGVPDPGQPIL